MLERREVSDEKVAGHSQLSSNGNHVVRVNTMGHIPRGVEADSMVGAANLCSDIRIFVLRGVQGVLAVRAKAER